MPARTAPKKRTPRLPKYRLNKTSGRACVELNGHVHWLGKYGTEESRQAYDRVIAEWLANGRRDPIDSTPHPDLTVNELVLRFWRHAESFYVGRDGAPAGELENFRHALRPLKSLYGFTQAKEFGPKALAAVRQNMIEKGWTRKSINKQVSRIRSVFRWGVSQEVLPAAVHQALASLPGLKKGKSEAKESKKVKPVPVETVEATKAHLSPTVQDMIDLQLLAGMRPGEMVIMRGCDIETAGDTWVYTPRYHKTEGHDVDRTIWLGPKAKEIVQKYLKPDLTAYLFSPREAEAHRYAAAELHRRPKQKPNEKKSDRTVGDCYDVHAYRRAIARGCDLAFPLPTHLARLRLPAAGRKKNSTRWESKAAWRDRLGPEQWAELRRWQREHRWHPNRLRHTRATQIRKEYGLDVAQVILGHTTDTMTAVYAERDTEKARTVMSKVG